MTHFLEPCIVEIRLSSLSEIQTFSDASIFMASGSSVSDGEELSGQDE